MYTPKSYVILSVILIKQPEQSECWHGSSFGLIFPKIWKFFMHRLHRKLSIEFVFYNSQCCRWKHPSQIKKVLALHITFTTYFAIAPTPRPYAFCVAFELIQVPTPWYLLQQMNKSCNLANQLCFGVAWYSIILSVVNCWANIPPLHGAGARNHNPHAGDKPSWHCLRWAENIFLLHAEIRDSLFNREPNPITNHRLFSVFWSNDIVFSPFCSNLPKENECSFSLSQTRKLPMSSHNSQPFCNTTSAWHPLAVTHILYMLHFDAQGM